MKIALACDHGGFPLKQDILQAIRSAGHEALDLGTYSCDPVDYPDFAQKAGEALQTGTAERAIVMCGSGVGACIAANKMHGVYAGLCHDTYSAHQGVEHDNMNMLCLGRASLARTGERDCRCVSESAIQQRRTHNRRLAKLHAIEDNSASHLRFVSGHERMTDGSFKSTTKSGQSIWYDNIQRSLLENGEMAAMINQGAIQGVTSNPSIFTMRLPNRPIMTLLCSRWPGRVYDRRNLYTPFCGRYSGRC
jgi:RpiB/LacA/LacB family sugar-phosphate isomerase